MAVSLNRRLSVALRLSCVYIAVAVVVAMALQPVAGADQKIFNDCVTSSSRISKSFFQQLPQTNQLYDTYVKRTFNTRYHNRRPAFIAMPTSAKDVSNLIKCANKAGFRYVVRDGGHSYEGMSLIDGGIVIDMSKLVGISIKNNQVTVGGGQRLGPVYLYLWQNGGYAFSGGNCVAVGVSGFTLGGGVGPNTRKMGAGVDALASARVVLADGRVVIASPSSNPDLFWALRGGSGSFGVVTSWTFSLRHKAPSAVTVLEVSWPSFRLKDVFAALAQWKPYNLDNNWAKVEWFYGFGSIVVSINYWGPKRDVETAMKTAPLFKVGDMTQRYFQELSYLDFLVKITNLQGDSSWSVENMKMQTVIDTEYGPNAKEQHKAYSFKAGSIMLKTDLSADHVGAMQRLVEQNGQGWVQGKALRGATDRPEGDTAYPHRKALWVLQAYSKVNSNNEVQWVKTMKDALRGAATGLEYVNYIDCAVPRDRVWETYFGPNAARLKTIKAKYDPNNRLDALTCRE